MSSPSFNVKNKILRAGAGAGKTTTLTNTFLDFAKNFKTEFQRYPKIAVTTFTRKATQELKERLLLKALEIKDEALFKYVSSKTQVQISTIHGILSLYLTRYGSAMGFTPDFKILGDFENRQQARKLLRKILLSQESGQELLEEYDFKTLEECFLLFYSKSFIYPEFKPATALQLQHITESNLETLISKLKSYCSHALAGCTNDKWLVYLESWISFKNKGSEESWKDFLERLEQFDDFNSKPIFKKASPPFLESVHDDLDLSRKAIKSFLQNPSHQFDYWEKHQNYTEVFDYFAKQFKEEFLTSKVRSGTVSMEDLELFSLKLIQDHPETAKKFSEEWDFWMIDEYQDTSPVQVKLLKNLVGEKPVFIVGDPQQSIYLFRGARSQVFQERIEEIRDNNGDVEEKLINYRSSPEILEFFNDYFTKVSPQFARMTPDPNKKRDALEKPVVDIIVTEKSDQDLDSSESLSVIARVQELLALGVAPEQICILGRTHKVLEGTAKIANKFGIPFQIHSGSGFFQRREILDALGILKFLMNPHDNPNLISLLRSPWFFMPDSEILSICHSQSHSYWAQALKTHHLEADGHPISILKTLLKEVEVAGLSWTLKKAAVDLGIFDYSEKIDSSGRREANLWKLIAMLSQEERRPGFNFLEFLEENLSSLTTEEGGEDSDATPVIEPKRVNLMTVHASKGLQFEHVILPGMGQAPRASTLPMMSFQESDGLWTLKLRDFEEQTFVASPLAQKISEDLKHLESQEFLRVLYVALTRAKAGVTLVWDAAFKSKSWAAEFPLLLDEGVHSSKGFNYRVRKENLTPQASEIKERVAREARLPWKANLDQQKWKAVSVTEISEDESFQKAETSFKGTQLGAALARAQQGTDAHRLFESLKYSSLETVLSLSDDSLKKAVEFIVQTKSLPLMSIVKHGFVEWGFAYRYHQVQIQGQIDLWGVVDDVLWVVDYKTGSQKFAEMALKQLEIYAWALIKMKVVKEIKRISLAIVYPLDEVAKVQDFADPSQFNELIESRLNKQLEKS